MQIQVYIKMKEIYTHQSEMEWSSSTGRSDRQGIVKQPAEESQWEHSCCKWPSAFKSIILITECASFLYGEETYWNTTQLLA